jgi:hypothetical protein
MRRHLLVLSLALPLTLAAKDPDWQSGDVANIDVIRTPIGKGKKVAYRYSYSIHGSGQTYTFDETKKLDLTVNGPVHFTVKGDKIHVLDERNKEHKETILKKAVDKP